MNDPTAATATATATATDTIRTVNPGWKHIVMVCKACEKRSNGPKKFGAKQVARALLLALRQARQPQTRVVQTSCLGLCPKRAVAVAACAPGDAVHVIAWHKRVDADEARRVLFGVTVAADPLMP